MDKKRRDWKNTMTTLGVVGFIVGGFLVRWWVFSGDSPEWLQRMFNCPSLLGILGMDPTCN